MPIPGWAARINKRRFNRNETMKGNRPVLTHIERRSGTTFHTPLDAHRVDGGHLFILMHGSGSDRVQNVLAAGKARLRADGEDPHLVSPRPIGRAEAWRRKPGTAKEPPGFLKVSEYPQMDIAG